MTTIDSLPKEVLAIIFGFLKSSKVAGNCRLVCKAWNDPAAMAMFSKPITLHRDDRLQSFIEQLEQHPKKRQYIRHLNLHSDQKDTVEKLLRLAFTPRIEELHYNESYSQSVDIHDIIVKIAQESPKKFDRLRRIPSEMLKLTDSYSKAISTFRETLEYLDICTKRNTEKQNLIQLMADFKRLKSLHLYNDFDNLHDLEATLQGCCHLKELHLTVPSFRDWIDDEDDNIEPHQLMAWAKKNVQQVDSVRKIEISALGYPSLMEYLLFKYPHTEYFHLNIFALDEIFEYDDLVSFNITRIIHALKHIRCYRLDYKIPAADNLNAICQAAVADYNVLSIKYCEFGGPNYMVMFMTSKQLEDGIRIAKFSVEIPTVADTHYHVKVISQAGISFDRLVIDFVNHSLIKNDWMYPEQLSLFEQAVVFFKSLYGFPKMKEFKLIANYINEATDMLYTHDEILLESLEICNAEITEDALEAVAYHCLKLKSIALNNCQLVPEWDNIYHIRMKAISFDEFVFQTVPVTYLAPHDTENWNNENALQEFDRVLNEVKTTWSEPFYLWLGIKQAEKKLYYKITPGGDSTKSITKTAYDARSTKSLVIHLSCRDIKSLLIHVGESRLSLDEASIHADLKSRQSYALDEDDLDNGDLEEDEEEDEEEEDEDKEEL